MPRKSRETSPFNIYHICNRGVDRRIIFDDDNDRNQFLRYLQNALNGGERSLLAWCLMTNHIHLLVKAEKEEMSKMMHDLEGNYAYYYNAVHGRSGYLFQDRFRSQPIDSEQYLLTAIRYVHQNPLKAGMAPSCAYKYNSFEEYLGEAKLVDTDLVLSILGGKTGFLSLHEDTEDDPRLIDFDNGWAMSEDEAWSVACRVIGLERAKSMNELERAERNECIQLLSIANIQQGYIAKLANLSQSSISRIVKPLHA